ncbi:YT521-B-like domain-domain-containing protein, partial [Phakopsora pachyrhizi]
MKNDHLISVKTLNFDVSNSSTQSPNSSNNESARGPLVRGSLAQAKLRSYSYKNNVSLETPLSGLSIKKTESLKVSKNPALPKLPPHSEHAIWVGNVPNDATVEELWNFFSSIPQKVQINQLRGKEQNNDDYEMGVNEILSNNGIKSIHIISKSNCAFINYISSQHLQKALLACNKKPLRSQTPTSKPLVCRIRKPEDNMKSGVGAQRIGGMHKSWIKKQKLKLKKNQNIDNSMADPSRNLHKLNEFNTEALTEISESDDSDSTTPSFLANNFPSRYFILKSYTEEDLKISVEKSMWASQSHNEPVLDQAFRTSPKGVYLIFSVNKSGEFFGYAKMVGPI